MAVLSRGSVIALDSPAALIRAAGSATRIVIPASRLAPARAMTLDGVDTMISEGLSTVITSRNPGRVGPRWSAWTRSRPAGARLRTAISS